MSKAKSQGDLVIYISDNESWIDTNRGWNSGTETMKHRNEFKVHNPKAKLVCIDIQPYAHTQAQEGTDILNVGGFSDQVFEILDLFAKNELDANHWVGLIENLAIC